MKIVHISPTYFAPLSLIGGGERYALDLALSMSHVIDTTFVSFGSSRKAYSCGSLKIELYPAKCLTKADIANPISLRYLNSILKFDVIHIHQINAIVSDLACLFAFFTRKRIFASDHGGGSGITLNNLLPISNCYRKVIAYSDFGKNILAAHIKEKTVVIKGGVDTKKFCPLMELKKQKKIIYVGRILPHKGIDYLIEGYRLLKRPDYKLVIIGPTYNRPYCEKLHQMSRGLDVEFAGEVDEKRLLFEYRTAMLTILPSVHIDYHGNYAIAPELMGLVLLESQACGTPVVCTDAGGMCEFVSQDQTGFVIKQNSPTDIAAAIKKILALSPHEYCEYQNRCVKQAALFSWPGIVRRYLDIYRNGG